MDSELLASRLILALLLDDPDEMAYHVWAIRHDSGLTEERFDLALGTARIAAAWWRENDRVTLGRELLTDRLAHLTAT